MLKPVSGQSVDYSQRIVLRSNSGSFATFAAIVTRRVMALLYNLQTVGLLNAQGNHASRRVNANEREGAGMHLNDLLKTS